MKLPTFFIISVLAISIATDAHAYPVKQPIQQGQWQEHSIHSGQKFSSTGGNEAQAANAFATSEATDETKIPTAVGNLQTLVTDRGMTVTVTWEAPTQDVSGGTLDPSVLTYSVYRSLGNDYTLLQSDLTETSFVDNSVKEALDGIGLQQESITYAVVATNSYGTGESVTQSAVAGTPFSLPFAESFANGYAENNPWTVQLLTGSFGWATMSDDDTMQSQDDDQGFIIFRNPFSEDAIDSRILSPLISLAGTQNPSITLFVYHWADADITDEGKSTKLTIEVTEDSRSFTQVGDPIMATAEQEGWQEHRISLADYAGCDQLRISLRGSMECYWMYYYADNIQIEETPAHDLCAMQLSGPEKLDINAEAKYTFSYTNRGSETETQYTLALYKDGVEVATIPGEQIAPGETKSVEIAYTPSAYDAGEASINAAVEADNDELADNNTSYNTVNITVRDPKYPTVSYLGATADDDKITISWEPAAFPTHEIITQDGIEDYQPFIIDNIGDWTVYDQDQYSAGAPYDFPDFPNKNGVQAFQVWNPYELDKELTADDAWLLPRTGNQCFICWYVMVSIGGVPQANDDWLVSPELSSGTTFSFYMRRLRTSTNETFQILQSTTSTEPSAFTVIDEGIATEDWTLYEIPVAEDVRYIAIRYTGCDQYGLMIDDVTYTSAIYGLRLIGYNLFRNGVKLNDEPLTETTYVDTDVTAGQTYYYCISALYDRGESAVSYEVEASPTSGVGQVQDSATKVYAADGCIIIDNANGETATIYNLSGTTVATSATTGKTEIEIPDGAYIVKIGNTATKVIVR